MDFLSLLFIAGFGLLFGLIFKDLMREFGASKELTESPIFILILPFLTLISYVLISFFLYFRISLSDFSYLSSFPDSPMIYVAGTMLVGSAIRFAADKLKEGKKAAATSAV